MYNFIFYYNFHEYYILVLQICLFFLVKYFSSANYYILDSYTIS